jgi:hypothetical protein
MSTRQSKIHKLVIKFNQQQLQLLDNLMKEGKYGNSYEDIVVNIFRDYLRQTFGKGGA